MAGNNFGKKIHSLNNAQLINKKNCLKEKGKTSHHSKTQDRMRPGWDLNRPNRETSPFPLRLTVSKLFFFFAGSASTSGLRSC